jgi:Ca-activated chloride channel family protein
MTYRTSLSIAATVLLGAIVTQTYAQQTGRTVLVPVSVLGATNTPVTGLTRENFQLLEENKEQNITVFLPERTPMSVSIILGAGALVRSDRVSERIMEAVETFKKAGDPANEYFVSPYGTAGVEDAIGRGLDQLNAANNRRKILVMFIDSFDTPAAAEQGALESAMKQDVPIYFMFMKNEFFRFSGKPTTAEDTAAYPASWLTVFEDVANYTGGRVINAEPLGNLHDEAAKLADELKNQYVLGFNSELDARVGKWRNLKVNVKSSPGQQKLTLRYKRRYFAFK